MNKPILISLAITAVLIGWALWVVGGNPGTDNGTTTVPTAVIVDGTQIIDITAKGGYSPRVVEAKAGVPTVLRVNTSGTFDCSSSLVIPSLGYQKFLKSSGTEEIAISAEKAQGTLQGLCSMGMYGFQIKFQ
ncbi:MAG: cupredoxin domain-containing protein [Minisyncoccia bacterium]